MGGISADDPNAVSKLESKLAKLETLQETMKAVNTYYRKNKTLDGCPHLSTEQIEKLKASMSGSYRANPKPFELSLIHISPRQPADRRVQPVLPVYAEAAYQETVCKIRQGTERKDCQERSRKYPESREKDRRGDKENRCFYRAAPGRGMYLSLIHI